MMIIVIALLLFYDYALQNTQRLVDDEVEGAKRELIALFKNGYQTPIESALSMMEMSPALNHFLVVPREQAELVRFDIEKQFVQLGKSYPQVYKSIRFIDGLGRERVVVEGQRRIREYRQLSNENMLSLAEQQVRELYERLKAGEPRLIRFSPVFHAEPGEFRFYAGIALLEPEIGGFGGAILIEGELKTFIEEVERTTYRGYKVASLLRGEGEIISQSMMPDVKDELSSHAFYPGTSVSEQPFLNLLMRVPVKILSEQQAVILKSALLVASIAIVVIFIVAWFLSRQIVRPITKLVNASKRFSEGDFSPIPAVHGGGEMGALLHALNLMASRLSESMKGRDKELDTRINAEIALQCAHADLQLILNSTSEGVFGVDSAGDFSFCNRAALAILGYEQEGDVLGSNMHTLIHHNHANGTVYSARECPIVSTLQSGVGVHRDDDVFWRADQSHFPVEYRAQPIIREDLIVGAVVTFFDITEQHNTEETLRRTQKMDALGKLTGGIAHDFNNMLGVILGYGELLEAMLADNPKQAKYIHEINNAGERAKKLTSRLLTFARKGSSSAEVTNFNKILLDEKHMLEKTLTAQITLSLDLEEGLWDVLIDRASLEDAILNMSINAMHAMPNGGYLAIRTRNIHFEDVDVDVQVLGIGAGDYVELSITDTGVGMDPDTRQKIFDPFFTTKGDFGTGLGMSQVYGFVKQAGGDIDLHSEPGAGTQIYLFFPRYTQQKRVLGVSPAVAQMSLLPGGHETILVVDDEPALCALASDILTLHGYRVLTAKSGVQALDILKSESVDLMLSDVIMPNMNGYALAQQVEKFYPKIKIQIASGFSDKQQMEGVNEKLHQQRLQKPYNSEQLLQRLRKLLDE